MHPLHDYVAEKLAEKLRAKKLVVWYDPRSEFAPFVCEVRGGARISSSAVPVTVTGIATQLAEYDGSMFELRANPSLWCELSGRRIPAAEPTPRCQGRKR